MKEISIEESKQIQLGILKTFIDFCDRNQLSYFLAYGSLIGAVRHQGFIPWDDDIDVQMPRADYDRLIRIFNQTNESASYSLISPYDKQAIHPYVKIIDRRTIKVERGVIYKSDFLGVDMDVFPIDGLPDTQPDYDRFYHKMRKLHKKFAYSKIKTDGKSVKELLLKAYQFVLGDSRRIVKKVEARLKRYPYEKSNYVGTLISYDDYYNDRHERDAYSDYVLMDFEGIRVKAPVGYKHILNRIYGNYMKLPPLDEQVTHHSYTTYWKE